MSQQILKMYVEDEDELEFEKVKTELKLSCTIDDSAKLRHLIEKVHGTLFLDSQVFFKGATLLMIACFNGHLNCVQLLLKSGVDLNKQDDFANTALTQACLKGHSDIVEYLVNNGANPSVKNKAGKTALIIAIENGHEKIARFLVDFTISNVSHNIGEDTKWKEAALITACQIGNTNIVCTLIEKGANVNHTQFDPLLIAVESSHTDVVRILIEAGADLCKNKSLLTKGVERGQYEIVECLLKHGVDPNSDDHERLEQANVIKIY